MNGKGPNAARQDAPHPHEVLVDPTGAYLIAPDLGADLLRIYTITPSSGQLTSCLNYKVPGGTGPRHATFKILPNGQTIMYVANELANSVSIFRVTYPSGGCLSLLPLESINPFANNATAPSGTKVAEVRVLNNNLYTAVRVDKLFSGNDSMATFSIDSSTGQVDFVNNVNAWGTYPRTFSVNRAGTLLAVGDQTTANVAILTIGSDGSLSSNAVANLRLGAQGQPENENGLSAVVWAE